MPSKLAVCTGLSAMAGDDEDEEGGGHDEEGTNHDGGAGVKSI